MTQNDGLQDLRARLGVAEDTLLLLNGMTLGGWGGAIAFTGLAGDQRFEFAYKDIREMRWRIYAHESMESSDQAGWAWPQNTPTPLLSIAFGRDQHRSPAQLLTERFGLSLYYGDLEIRTSEPFTGDR